MIKLRTGLPGAGKTLNTIFEVVNNTQGKQVFYTNFQKFTQKDVDEKRCSTSALGLCFDPEHAYYENVKDWIYFDIEELKLVDLLYSDEHPILKHGSIILVDECQDIYPTRTKAEVPAFIKFFEKHRHTGCDFFLITQQIRQIDIHLRSLVGDHEDFKRVMGRDLIRVRQLNRVIEGKDETSTELLTSNRPYPKQLFGLYKSAPVHTHKRKMPKILTIVLPLALLFILISFYTVYNVLFDTKPVALLEAEKTSSEAPKKPDAASAVPGLTPSDKSSFSGTTAPQLLLNDDIFVVGEMSYKGALVTMFELYFAGRFIALNTQELVALGFEVSRIAPFLYKVNGSIVSTRPKPDYDRSYTADSDSEKDDSGSGSRSGSSISDAPGSLPQMPGLLE